MNNKKHFLLQVTQYVKSKEAKKLVEVELNNHLEQSIALLMKSGYTQEEAESKAIMQMGNPDQIGIKMNQLHKPIIDWGLISLFVILQLFSLIPYIFSNGLNELFLSIKIFDVVIGIIIVLSVMFFNYRTLLKWTNPSMIIIITILFLMNIEGLTKTINGYKVFALPFYQVNTSVLLPFLLISWAGILYKAHYKQPKEFVIYFDNKKVLSQKMYMQVRLFVYIVIIFFLYFPTSTLPSNLTLFMMCSIMFIWAFRKYKTIVSRFIYISAMIVIGGIAYFLFTPMTYNRLLAFLQPEDDASGYIYMIQKEYITDASILFKRGNVELPSIPEAHTDLIFTSIIHMFGWGFAIVLVGLFLLIMIRIGMLSQKVVDPFGQYIIIGAAILFTFPILYNLGMSVGLLPLASFTLPFFSFGTLATVVNSFLIGMVLSVYRRKNECKLRKERL